MSRVVRVMFKDEDEIDGMTVGPIYIVREGNQASRPRSFDPSREPGEWVTLQEARRIADEHGVELEQS